MVSSITGPTYFERTPHRVSTAAGSRQGGEPCSKYVSMQKARVYSFLLLPVLVSGQDTGPRAGQVAPRADSTGRASQRQRALKSRAGRAGREPWQCVACSSRLRGRSRLHTYCTYAACIVWRGRGVYMSVRLLYVCAVCRPQQAKDTAKRPPHWLVRADACVCVRGCVCSLATCKAVTVRFRSFV